MADISDVEQALVDTITAAIYPAGPSQASIVGALCRIYRGWPNAATLNTDLNAGVVNVTVGTENDSGRTTTRYLLRWQSQPMRPGTSASVAGEVISISGIPIVGDVVGAMVDRVTFVYRVQSGDTFESVAANLAQSIQGSRMATLQGANITVPGASSIVARVVCDAPATAETRRQEKDLRIICWCPTPLIRDSVASALDASLNGLSFLPLPDTSEARIVYRNTASFDQAQNALLYRRDLVYTVEYATITTIQQPSMLFGASDLNSNITYG